jgi:hypothetical protein
MTNTIQICYGTERQNSKGTKGRLMKNFYATPLKRVKSQVLVVKNRTKMRFALKQKYNMSFVDHRNPETGSPLC